MKTLVYHTGALGDFLATLPAIGAWRRKRPHDAVILLGKPAHGEVGICSGYFNEVWDADNASWAWLFAPGAAYPAHAPALFADINAALLYTALSGAPVRRLQALGVKEVQVFAPLPQGRISIYLHYLSFIEENSFLPELSGPLVAATADYIPQAAQILGGAQGAVALHPGSGSAIKNWPIERFQTLASSITRSRASRCVDFGPGGSRGALVPCAARMFKSRQCSSTRAYRCFQAMPCVYRQ